MDKKLKMGIGMGGPSIITIFVTLCLSTLGMLSLMTANADWELTQKNASFLTSYYKADGAVENWLADVDAALQKGESLDSHTFKTPISANQDLVVVIQVVENEYEIVSHKLVSNQQWNYDTFEPTFEGSIAE